MKSETILFCKECGHWQAWDINRNLCCPLCGGNNCKVVATDSFEYEWQLSGIKPEHDDLWCTTYNAAVLPDEAGDCSLCGASLYSSYGSIGQIIN